MSQEQYERTPAKFVQRVLRHNRRGTETRYIGLNNSVYLVFYKLEKHNIFTVILATPHIYLFCEYYFINNQKLSLDLVMIKCKSV